MMLEWRSEKLILQRSQLMVSLYDWLCLFAIIAASFLYTTLAVGPIPPDTVNTSGEKHPRSTSLTRWSLEKISSQFQ